MAEEDSKAVIWVKIRMNKAQPLNKVKTKDERGYAVCTSQVTFVID
jgi:hypothetical protein